MVAPGDADMGDYCGSSVLITQDLGEGRTTSDYADDGNGAAVMKAPYVLHDRFNDG